MENNNSLLDLEKIYQNTVDLDLSLSNTLYEFEKYKPTIIKRPSRPLLVNKNDLKEVKEYSIKLENYEENLKEYNKQYKDYQKLNYQIDSLKEKYIKEKSGLNSIPEKYRDKVYSYAYEQGHSDGHHEVFNYLVDLVEIFN